MSTCLKGALVAALRARLGPQSMLSHPPRQLPPLLLSPLTSLTSPPHPHTQQRTQLLISPRKQKPSGENSYDTHSQAPTHLPSCCRHKLPLLLSTGCWIPRPLTCWTLLLRLPLSPASPCFLSTGSFPQTHKLAAFLPLGNILS